MAGLKPHLKHDQIFYHYNTLIHVKSCQDFRCLHFYEILVNWWFPASRIPSVAVFIDMGVGCHCYTVALTPLFYVLSGRGVVLRVSSRQQWTIQQNLFFFFFNSRFFFVFAVMKRVKVSRLLCCLYFLPVITFLALFGLFGDEI